MEGNSIINRKHWVQWIQCWHERAPLHNALHQGDDEEERLLRLGDVVDVRKHALRTRGHGSIVSHVAVVIVATTQRVATALT